MNGWKTIVSFWAGLVSGDYLSFREGSQHSFCFFLGFGNGNDFEMKCEWPSPFAALPGLLAIVGLSLNIQESSSTDQRQPSLKPSLPQNATRNFVFTKQSHIKMGSTAILTLQHSPHETHPFNPMSSFIVNVSWMRMGWRMAPRSSREPSSHWR